MKKTIEHFIGVVLCFFLVSFQLNAQLTTNGGLTGMELAEIIAGQGISISNVTLTCPDNASGSFANGATTNIGVDHGVLMTTGDISTAIGPNLVGNTSIDNGGGGDADLMAASGFTTFNACVLEFDFVPSANRLTIDYVFASEEYNEWVCTQFNDIFAFYVTGPNPTGPDYVKKDIALVPGKSIPVTINNINNGSPGANSTGNCGDLTNSAFYIHNEPGPTIGYDGFTVLLQASLDLIPCETYQFKFAIADASDAAWDAGVFLKEASFQTNNIIATATDSPEGCPGGEIIFTAQYTTYVDYTININVLGSSAASPSDYHPFGLDYILPAGQQTLTIPIESIGDILLEGDESIDFEYVFDPGCFPTTAYGSIDIIDGPITCEDYVLVLDGYGYGSITPEDVLTGDPFPPCPDLTFDLSKEDFVCEDEGPNLVTVTASDHGHESTCTSTITVVVPPDIITVDLGDDCRVVYWGYAPFECTDITASASGGTPPYSYLWSTGETTQTITVCPEVTTLYNVVVTDVNGCVQVSEFAEVEVIDVHCGNNGDKVLVCHIPPGEPENLHTICIGFDAVAAHLAHGDYLATCGDIPCDGMDLFEQLPVELRESVTMVNPSVFPNPTSGAISLRDYEHMIFTSISVVNMEGKVIDSMKKDELISSKGNIEFVNKLTEGTYLVKFENKGDIAHLLRFIKLR